MEQTANLFVYGTLRRGEQTEFASKLMEEAQYAGEARVRGQLFRLTHYPAMVRSESAWVQGDLFADVPAELFNLLDAYEGTEYTRELIDADTEKGESVQAWVYIYARSTEGLVQITSGDWLQR